MNNCVYCSLPTKGKVCMAKDCQNKKKKQHYHDNLEHYRKIKREESKRNYERRATRRKQQGIVRYYKDFVATILRTVKARAKEYSMEFDLDRTFIVELYEKQDKKCALTGITFTSEKEIEYRKRRPFAPSLDRINYKKGYTKDNVRLVCSIVNIALSDFGDEAFDRMCRSYIRNNHG